MRNRVAIIDQGVQIDHPRLANSLISQITITESTEGIYQIGHNDSDDLTGHGTAIAGIIHGINPLAELLSIKITSSGTGVKTSLIAKAISYCTALDDIEIINLSLGVPSDDPPQDLYLACKKASENGIAVIASAYHLSSTNCYPAFFPFVFGVGTGLVTRKTQYSFIKDSAINILAKGSVQRVAWRNSSFRIASGTSYATAHFSGILSTLIENRGMSYLELEKLIERNSSNDVQNLNHFKGGNKFLVQNQSLNEIERFKKEHFSFQNKSKFVGKVALYPISEKELKTIMEQEHLCSFEIVLYLDYPKSFSGLGSDQKSKNKHRIVRRIPNESEFDSFDTIVLGYILDDDFEANLLMSIAIVAKCIEQSKNFIVWDKTTYDLIQDQIPKINPSYQGKIYFSEVSEELFTKIQGIPGLPKMASPILSVVGTSSKQGKFTTQLRVMEILTNEGYKISHVGTEPQSFLFGSDLEFPIGYKSTVDLIDSNWIIFLEKGLRCIQDINTPDLILTGIQGGVIPRDNQQQSGYILSALNYLIAVNPDYVICCINPTDTKKIINRTLQTIRTFCGAKNLFFAMTPWQTEFIKTKNGKYVVHNRLMSKDDYKKRMDQMEKKLKSPVINIMDKNNNDFILSSIQNAFTAEKEPKEYKQVTKIP
ncbi:S8 family peptidase [Maribacter flavus]|uniref:S8 family serine peptidase n=1 Tax=Maribacter flavus TaxID=1658664 RepID=A0A5B2TPC2_9FLAO|nr:S8 family serine peptidase [Maribacter flavus]KAA2215795.1 S8 family serine peptidase [Maribacter flavus]